MSSSKKPKSADPELVNVLMYVGPTVHKLNLIQNVVYQGIPTSAFAAIEETPLIRALFMPVESYPEAEKAIREETGYIWEAWKAALKYK